MARNARRTAEGCYANAVASLRKRRPAPHTRLSSSDLAIESRLIDKCVAALLEILPIRRQYTERYVRAQVEGLLLSAVATKPPSAPNETIANLIDRLSKPVAEATVFFPLEGVQLRSGFVPFGGGVFRGFDSSRVIADVPAIIGRDLTTEETAMVNALSGTLGLEIRVAADHDKAIEIATLRAERIAAVLTFLSTLEYGDIAGNRIALPRPHWSATPPIFVVSERTWETVQTTRPTNPFLLPINDGLEALFRKHAVAALIEILASVDEDVDTIERTILDSLFWFAAALDVDRVEMKILNYATAGELFFSANKQNVSRNFAEGAAYLLAGSDDVEAQRNIRKQIEELYDLRSRIAHEGQRDRSNRVVDLRRLVRELILAILTRREQFRTRKQLLDWVECRRQDSAATRPS